MKYTKRLKIDEIVIGLKVQARNGGAAQTNNLKFDRLMQKNETGTVTNFISDRVEIKLDSDGAYTTRVGDYLNYDPLALIEQAYEIY